MRRHPGRPLDSSATRCPYLEMIDPSKHSREGRIARRRTDGLGDEGQFFRRGNRTPWSKDTAAHWAGHKPRVKGQRLATAGFVGGPVARANRACEQHLATITK